MAHTGGSDPGRSLSIAVDGGAIRCGSELVDGGAAAAVGGGRRRLARAPPGWFSVRHRGVVRVRPLSRDLVALESPDKDERPLVSVVLPTFNEAATIVDVVDDVLEELVLFDTDVDGIEVIVVDDDSPDGTWRIAREAFDGDDRVRVLRRTTDQGLSSAVLDGFSASRGHYAVCMDADGQHPPDKILTLVETLWCGEPKDLAVGSRHVDGGSIEGWPASRKVTSKIATLLARGFVPAAREIADPMSGFFAIDREVFTDDVLETADPHGYKILLELAALVPDAEIAEVPITFRARVAGESNLTVDEQLRFVEHIIGLWFLSVGLDERVNPPLFIRSVEAAALVGFALPLLYLGLIIGDVDGAGGAALIAAAGAGIALGLARLSRTGDSWNDSKEVFAK